MLGTETTFSHSFSNRSVAYYGSQPYSYNGGYHPPQPFSSNKYLNDIDSIIDSPKHMRDKFISEEQSHNCSMETITETFKSIEHFLVYLHEWAPYARIKILSILPRESKVRNYVISRINSYIHSLTQRFSFVEHPDSMFNRAYLFANKAGFRKSMFFSSHGSDNVHLNQKGIIRFAKYLKYIGHND